MKNIIIIVVPGMYLCNTAIFQQKANNQSSIQGDLPIVLTPIF